MSPPSTPLFYHPRQGQQLSGLATTRNSRTLSYPSSLLHNWAHTFPWSLTRPSHPFKIAKRENLGETPPKTGMAQDQNAPNAVDQAVSRAVRDNLERIQRTADELNHAVSDVVSACASNKPTNTLPPMLRAQTAAASLAAALEVLTKFVTVSLQAGPRSPLEAQITNLVSQVAVEAPRVAQRPDPVPQVAPQAQVEPAPVDPAPPALVEAPQHHPEPELEPVETAEVVSSVPETIATGGFDLSRLSPEDQELHRRANRVAKVSMQDIKMLRPEAVRLGRENKDLCVRLKDDLEKAHREYERRFKAIMDQPVDYFYQWTLDVLADGKPEALGEYPYSTSVRQH